MGWESKYFPSLTASSARITKSLYCGDTRSCIPRFQICNLKSRISNLESIYLISHEASLVLEFLFDAQQLVILADAIRAAGGTGLDLAGVSCNG